MDFGMLFMNQGMPDAGAVGMKNNGFFSGSESSDSGSEFVNLLDVVESMEVAELGSVSDKDFNMAQTMKALRDDHSEKVSSEKNAALAGLILSEVELNSGLVNKFVGQEAIVTNNSLETNGKVTNEVVLPRDLIMGQSLLHQPDVRTPEDKSLNMASVAAWTSAFASGELDSVEVSNAQPDDMGLASKRRMASLENQIARDVPPRSSVESLRLQGEELTPLAPSKPHSLNAALPLARGAAQSAQGSDPEAFVAMATKVERVSGSELQGAQRLDEKVLGAEQETSQQVKKATSVQAKDLFLERSGFALSSQSDLQSRSVLASSSALKGDDLSVADANVVDFVSDKVLDLQKAGGGSLRVGLDTKDMGQIEIKVSFRGGRVDVSISGESGELTRQLQAGRSELSAKLGQHVELGDLKIVEAPTRTGHDVSSLMSRMGAARLSEDLVRVSMRDGVESNANVESLKNEKLDSLRAAGPMARSSEGHPFNGETSRDEKREQALNQWAAQSRLRQSA
jgi:hypothetical protein